MKKEINTKAKLESLIDSELIKVLKAGQQQLKEEIEIKKYDVETINRFLPQTTELLLKHLDILLETSKTFLIASSTVFAAAWAINDQNVLTFDINKVRIVSFMIIILSSLAMGIILCIRRSKVKNIIDQLARIEKNYRDISDVNKKIINLTSPKTIDELRENVKTTLKNDPITKHFF